MFFDLEKFFPFFAAPPALWTSQNLAGSRSQAQARTIFTPGKFFYPSSSRSDTPPPATCTSPPRAKRSGPDFGRSGGPRMPDLPNRMQQKFLNHSQARISTIFGGHVLEIFFSALSWRGGGGRGSGNILSTPHPFGILILPDQAVR